MTALAPVIAAGLAVGLVLVAGVGGLAILVQAASTAVAGNQASSARRDRTAYSAQSAHDNVLDISVGDYQYPILHSGRWLVWVGNGVTAISDDLSGRPRILARTPLFAPAARPGYIWLEQGPASNLAAETDPAGFDSHRQNRAADRAAIGLAADRGNERWPAGR
jgi:hypothetical protein